MILFAVIQALAVVRALRLGRWRDAYRDYARTEAPLAYWREIALACLVILLASAAALFMPAPTNDDPSPPYVVGFVAILFLPRLIRAVWAGEIVYGSNRWGRHETPYWGMLFIGLAFIGLLGLVSFVT